MNKLYSILILLSFLVTSIIGPDPVYAQELHLPAPGVMVHLSPLDNPPVLKGVTVYPNDPFKFDFILDKGDNHPVVDPWSKKAGALPGGEEVRREAIKLVKYFLASITTPENDLWVNLSPYEKNRIIPESFGQTDMGRDLLGEDYILKQVTASLIYPEGEIGKQFWRRVYQEAVKKFGTTNIPINTFNKVWIVPDHAKVYEHGNTAFVVNARLKVMLEEDYLALQKHKNLSSPNALIGDPGKAHTIASQIIREIVIPQLEKEVNEGKNFAVLRQVYNSLILAVWFKKRMKDSILGRKYMDQNKISNLLSSNTDPTLPSPNVSIGDPDMIYQRYLKAFKKGVYNYIKEEPDPMTQEMVPRKYFSGGTEMNRAMQTTQIVENINPVEIASDLSRPKDFETVSVDLSNQIDHPNMATLSENAGVENKLKELGYWEDFNTRRRFLDSGVRVVKGEKVVEVGVGDDFITPLAFYGLGVNYIGYEEALRIIKPGGKIVITIRPNDHPQEVATIIKKTIETNWKNKVTLRPLELNVPFSSLIQPSLLMYQADKKDAAMSTDELVASIGGKVETLQEAQVKLAETAANKAMSIQLINVEKEEAQKVMKKVKIHDEKTGERKYLSTKLNIVDIQQLGMLPKYKVETGKRTIYFSTPYYLGKKRIAVLGYVQDGDVFVSRTYYVSGSEAQWRYLPRVRLDKDGKIEWYDKGYSENSLRLPHQLQKVLAQMQDPEKMLRLNDAEQRLLFAGTTNSERRTYAGVMDPIPQEIIFQHGTVAKGVSIPPGLLKFSNGDKPDLDRLIDSYSFKSLVYGQVTARIFNSYDEKYIFTFLQDRKGRCWMAIEINASLDDLTSLGLMPHWVNGGPFVVPAYEYEDQSGFYGDSTHVVRDDQNKVLYVDMWKNYLSKIPIMREFRERYSDGLEVEKRYIPILESVEVGQEPHIRKLSPTQMRSFHEWDGSRPVTIKLGHVLVQIRRDEDGYYAVRFDKTGLELSNRLDIHGFLDLGPENKILKDLEGPGISQAHVYLTIRDDILSIYDLGTKEGAYYVVGELTSRVLNDLAMVNEKTAKEKTNGPGMIDSTASQAMLGNFIFLEPEKIFNYDSDFLAAVEYFNKHILVRDKEGRIEPLTLQKIVDLLELFKGERKRLAAENYEELRERRLSDKWLGAHLEGVVNGNYEKDRLLDVVVQFYLGIITKHVLFYRDRDYRRSLNDFEGHHRLAWFLMNFILIRHGYRPFYFKNSDEYESVMGRGKYYVRILDRYRLINLIRERVFDNSMAATTSKKSMGGPGGIDLTSKRMKLEVDSDKAAVSQSMNLKALENIEINGLYIKDMRIKPLKNLPELLGVA